MDIITSPSNQTVKRIAKLKTKKYRDEQKEFVIDGFRNVADTAFASPSSVKLVVFSESGYKKYGSEFTEFSNIVLSDAVFGKIADTETAQGVLSVNKSPEFAFSYNNSCVLLDRVRDPGNVGTILRTCCACGYDVVLNNCADILSPKVVRSSMSAILKCNIGLDIDVQALKQNGYELIAADMNGENVFTATKPTGKYCIVIGNEGDGINADILAACDRTLSIPMQNIESLNASVAAGVMMYALRYQNN